LEFGMSQAGTCTARRSTHYADLRIMPIPLDYTPSGTALAALRSA
jgi:hypothetical protein